MKKGAIFDMDGTLFDTERLYMVSWIAAAEHFGLTPQPDFPFAVSGTSGEGQREIIRRFYPGADAHAIQDYCMANVKRLLEDGTPVKPGAREILAYFQEHGVKIAIASSNQHSVIEDNLRNAELVGFFDAIISGEDVEHGKPAPDIFLMAAKALSCAPEDCYVFEDSVNGAHAGIAAGCVTIMVPENAAAPSEDLRKTCAGIYSGLLEALREIEKTER